MWYQLIPLDGGLPISVEQADVVVGRSRSHCDVLLKGSMVSKRHACLTWANETLTVEDLGSRNGTWLNGEKVEKSEIRSGDELSFGSCAFRVEFSATPTRQPTAFRAAEDVRESSTCDETTTVSLDLLDHLLVRESDVKDAVLLATHPRPIPADQIEDAPAFTEPATVAAADCVPPSLAHAPAASDDDVMQKLLAEFDAAKAAKSAGTAIMATPIVVAKLPASDSFVSDENSTGVEVTDDDEWPAPSESAASAPTVHNETMPTSVDRPLWNTPPRIDLRTYKSTRLPSYRSTSLWEWRAQIPKVASSPTTLAVIAIVLLAGAWHWYGAGDRSTIQLCLRLRNELVERRTQGKTSGPEWEAFCQQAVADLKVSKKVLDQSVDGRQPERQALLFAIRDELVMLSQNVHWQRELSPKARKLEESFDRHLKIAQGQIILKESLPSNHGSVPPGDPPDPVKSGVSRGTIRLPTDSR